MLFSFIEYNSIICRLLPPANEVYEGCVFTRVCHSVHRGGVSRPISRGEVLGSGLGGVVQAHTRGGDSGQHPGRRVSRPRPGGVSQHALRQTPPPSRWLLLRAVCTLLECILVKDILILLGCPNCEFFGVKVCSHVPSRHHFLNVTFNFFKRYMTLDATFF